MWSSRDAPHARCPYCTHLFGPDAKRREWDVELAGSNVDAAVVPTRGTLTPGWLLVIPRVHVLNTRALDDSMRVGFCAAVDVAVDCVTHAFGPVTRFEHGPSQEGSVVGCGVDHAHLHLVPLDFDLAAAARRHPLARSLRWVRGASASHAVHPANQAFLTVTTPFGEQWEATGDIPSQFFRRVIAQELGVAERFDWRQESNPTALARTIGSLPASAPITAAVAAM